MAYPIKEELEKKVWYRLLKVVLIVLVIILFFYSIVAAFLIYSDVKPYKIYGERTIICDNNETYKLRDVTGYNSPLILTAENNKIKKLCAGVSLAGSKTPVEKNYTLHEPFQMKGSQILAIFYSILGFIIILGGGILLLWLIKKSFFYITYGKKK